MVKGEFLSFFVLLVILFSISIVSANHECYTVDVQTECGPPFSQQCGEVTVCPIDRTPLDYMGSGDPGQNQMGESSVPGVGSVNTFNGNLFFQETDLSLNGRGMDISITRNYNSNIFAVGSYNLNQGRKNDLLKPRSPFGYGWSFHMGKITPIEDPNELCNNLNLINSENIVEFPDGSTSRFINDSTNQYNEKPGSYILDNFAKVNIYHHTFGKPYGYFEVVGNDARYIFNHWVLNHEEGAGNCVNTPWSDSTSNSYKGEQHPYYGVYLTEIIDVWGNRIKVEYYDQEFLDPNSPEAFALDYNDVSRPISHGSPFIKEITDTIGRKIDFIMEDDPLFTDENGIPNIKGKIDYIEYDGVNGRNRVDYLYSNELDSELYQQSCSCGGNNLCSDVCDENSLLVEVRHTDDTGTLLFPPTHYSYDGSSGSPSIFKLTQKISPTEGSTTYQYKDFGFCGGGGDYKYLNSLWKYEVTPTPGESYMYEYDYFNPDPDNNCNDWLRSSILMGPTDDNGKFSIVKTDNILDLNTESSNYFSLDWRRGLEISKSVHSADYYDNILHRPYLGPASGWDLTMTKKSTNFYTSRLIGNRVSINYNSDALQWQFLEGSISNYRVPILEGVLTEVRAAPDSDEDGDPIICSPNGQLGIECVKFYFIEYRITDKYGHQKKVKDWGEVESVTKNYNSGGTEPSLTSDLTGIITIEDYPGVDDYTLTETTYLYEVDPYYEGGDQNNYFKDQFQNIDAVSEVITYDLGGVTKLAHTKYEYDTPQIPLMYTYDFYGEENYQNHLSPLFTPRKKGALSKIKVWNSDKGDGSQESHFMITQNYYDDAGNLVQSRDPVGHDYYGLYDLEHYNDYAPLYSLPPGGLVNTCNDGIDNDGDGCVDENEEDGDLCNLIPEFHPDAYLRHEGLIHGYETGGGGFEYRISAYCDLNANDEDPACSNPTYSSNLNKCTPNLIVISNLNPELDEFGVPLNPTLQWRGSGQGLTYDINFDTTPNFGPEDIIIVDLNRDYYTLEGLQPGTTYYWQISATDENGNTALGDLWHFTTIDEGTNLILGRGGPGVFDYWDDEKHGFLTKTIDIIGTKSLVKEFDYYPDGKERLIKDYSTSSNFVFTTENIFDDLGRLTQVYMTGDVPGNPTSFIIYDDSNPIERKEITYSKRDAINVLVVDNNYNTNYFPEDDVIDVLDSFDYDYTLVQGLNGFNNLQNINDHNVILWIQGTSFFNNDGGSETTTITNLEQYLDNGGNIWIMGFDSVFQLLLQGNLQQFTNDYLHYDDFIENYNNQLEIDSISGVEPNSFIGDLKLEDLTEPPGTSINIKEFVLDPVAMKTFTLEKEIIEGGYNTIKELDVGVGYEGDYKVLLTNFDLSFINSNKDRKELLKNVFLWFSKSDVDSSEYNIYFNPVISTYDLNGRIRESRQDDIDGQTIYSSVVYDDQGNEEIVYRPYKSGESQTYTHFKDYDELSRVKEIEFVNQEGLNSVLSFYGSNFVKQIDRMQVETFTKNDARGRVIEVRTRDPNEVEDKITLTKYDKLGNIDLVTNSENQVIDYEYNSLGKLRSKTEPNMNGPIQYNYDNNGNLIQTVDSNNNIITYEYDTLNRLESIIDSLGNEISFTYIDILGKMMDKVAKIDDSSGTWWFIYDSRGRLQQEKFIPNCGCSSGCADIDNSGYVHQDDYDEYMDGDFNDYSNNKDFNGDGIKNNVDDACFLEYFSQFNQQQVSCPPIETRCTTNPIVRNYNYDYSGNIVNVNDNQGNNYDYDYDNLGRLTSTSYNGQIISDNYQYNSRGFLTEYELGGGIIRNIYNYINRETDLIKGQSSLIIPSQINVFNRVYTYDENNNLITEQTFALDNPIVYSYDFLNRLTNVMDGTGLSDIYPDVDSISYSYDSIGNRLLKSIDITNTDSYNYNQGTSKLDFVVLANGDKVEYQYDDNGNIINEVFKDPDGVIYDRKDFYYNEYNQLEKAELYGGNCIRYYYNGDGNRYRKEDGTNGIFTQYNYDSTGKLISEINWHGIVMCEDVPICGNGIIDTGEICDFGRPSAKTCGDLEGGGINYYNDNQLVECNSNCDGYDTSSCVQGICGDGIVNRPYELCDINYNTLQGQFYLMSTGEIVGSSGTISCELISNVFNPEISTWASCSSNCKYEIQGCQCGEPFNSERGYDCLETRDDAQCVGTSNIDCGDANDQFECNQLGCSCDWRYDQYQLTDTCQNVGCAACSNNRNICLDIPGCRWETDIPNPDILPECDNYAVCGIGKK